MQASRLRDTITKVTTGAEAVRILHRQGMLPAVTDLPSIVRETRSSKGAAPFDALAARFGDRPAVIDSGVPMSYRELAQSIRRWMNVLHDAGAGSGSLTVGVMCRNSSDLIIVMLGSILAGARLVFFNTDMGPEQVRLVSERDDVQFLVHDQEFAGAAAAAVSKRKLVSRHTDETDGDTLADTLANASAGAPPRAKKHGKLVILTSGSTGTPRGASRDSKPGSMLTMIGGLLQKIPLRTDDRILLAPPAFHGWGLITTATALGLGATLVFEGKFDAKKSMAAIEKQNCTVLIAVPTMLKRIMSLDEATLAPAVGHLRIIGSGGARLDPELVVEIGEKFGHVLHNLYGATEVSFITIATPDDLARDPDCAGPPPIGVTLSIMRDGVPVPAGESGDIFVHTSSMMNSYTDGTHKESIDGLVKTGDTGFVDADGRLFVRGRSDGMIVSGGENVYPEEVELALSRHPQVSDSYVYSVADDDFGQRIAAVVVADESAVSTDELKQFIANTLSRSRVPRDITMVDDLPRTATGKVTRQSLNALLAEKNSETSK